MIIMIIMMIIIIIITMIMEERPPGPLRGAGLGPAHPALRLNIHRIKKLQLFLN